MCDPTQDQSTYTGYQVELFRTIAQDLGWSPSDYFFSCLDWTPMISDLTDPMGSCYLAAAGVEVSVENLAMGIQFSWPIYKNGLSVVISGHVEKGGIWAFTNAFHWSLWLTMGGTAVAVALLCQAIEWLTHREANRNKGLSGWLYICFSSVMEYSSHVGDPKSWATRLIMLAYAFLVLIVVNLYTASSAAYLTQQKLDNSISSKADLPGKSVETWTNYVSLVQKYSINAVGLRWDNDDDTLVLFDNIKNGLYKALILDTPVVDYYVAKDPSCELFSVGGSFETFNLALAFSPDTNLSEIKRYTQSIVKLQQNNATLDYLENQQIKVGGHTCAQAPGSTQHGTAVTIDQVAGLWIILAIAVGVALIGTFIQRYMKSRRKVGGIAGAGGGKRKGAVYPESPVAASPMGHGRRSRGSSLDVPRGSGLAPAAQGHRSRGSSLDMPRVVALERRSTGEGASAVVPFTAPAGEEGHSTHDTPRGTQGFSSDEE